MALTYSGLAVLTGKIFGGIQNNPYLFFIVANVIFFFALAMLDIIPLPTLGGGLQSKIKVKNLTLVHDYVKRIPWGVFDVIVFA